ncbi:hypothetical protein NPIL_176381 [Nephila pilipes]|uniref:Uncharacterized protein n=1 Tax=Nephila pilipes TaxID=299642 RepID=A0A8X6PMC4_NEPPI|nr:hypothetical protein NPIL_176381 [Nephila pilipes]
MKSHALQAFLSLSTHTSVSYHGWFESKAQWITSGVLSQRKRSDCLIQIVMQASYLWSMGDKHSRRFKVFILEGQGLAIKKIKASDILADPFWPNEASKRL